MLFYCVLHKFGFQQSLSLSLFFNAIFMADPSLRSASLNVVSGWSKLLFLYAGSQEEDQYMIMTCSIVSNYVAKIHMYMGSEREREREFEPSPCMTGCTREFSLCGAARYPTP